MPIPWVLHVDLDQFVVAVELLRRPELRGRPVLVGGSGDPTRRGVVAGASYEARAYGVRSGTPLRTAARRCPQARFLPADRRHYEAASRDVMATLRQLSATVEVLGWDEAFLGVLTDDPEGYARMVQSAVLERTRLPCSVGIGDNRLRAKVASGLAKPGGVRRLTADTWFDEMGSRPAASLPGVGGKTARRLNAIGVRTVGQLAVTDVAELSAAFGPRAGPHLRALANGVSGADVTSAPPSPRSQSSEVTFDSDVADAERVREELRRLTRRLAEHADPHAVRRVVVKVRYQPFETHTHGVATPATTTRDVGILERTAVQALEHFGLTRPVRLIGVRLEFEPPAGGPGERALR